MLWPPPSIKDGDKSSSQSVRVSHGAVLWNWLLQRRAPSCRSEWMKVERGWVAVSTRRLLPDALSAAASHLGALASVCLPDFNIASELFETLFCFTPGKQSETLFAPLWPSFAQCRCETSRGLVLLWFWRSLSLSVSHLFFQIRRWQVTSVREPLIVDATPASLLPRRQTQNRCY